MGYRKVTHNVVYRNKKHRRQVDIEYYFRPNIISGLKKGICECKYRESNYFDIEKILRQTLSAKKFVKADQACVATNYVVDNKDQIYNKTGVIIYDRIMLEEMDNIKGENSNKSLEEKIFRTNGKYKLHYKRI